MSAARKYAWFKIEGDIVWQENNMCIVIVNDKKITLARYNNAFFAFAHKCPHAGGIMADGFIDALGNVVCPLHRYKFSMQNGRNVSGEGYYLKSYLIDNRPDGMYIGIEEKGFLGIF